MTEITAIMTYGGNTKWANIFYLIKVYVENSEIVDSVGLPAHQSRAFRGLDMPVQPNHQHQPHSTCIYGQTTMGNIAGRSKGCDNCRRRRIKCGKK
jgi:hypothetical protein